MKLSENSLLRFLRSYCFPVFIFLVPFMGQGKWKVVLMERSFISRYFKPMN